MTLSGIVLAISIALLAVGAVGAPKLPSREAAIVVPLLRGLPDKADMSTVEAILGHHDREAGSGRCIFAYTLEDGSEIVVNTGDCKHLGWISWSQKDKKAQLLFEAKQTPNQSTQPPPAPGPRG